MVSVPPTKDLTLKLNISKLLLTKIIINTKEYLANSSINVSKESNATCFGHIIKNTLSYYKVQPDFNETAVLTGNVTYLFSIKTSTIFEQNASPQSIFLYKCSNKTEDWRPLPTKVIGMTTDYINYSAESPSFSTYAITASTTASTPLYTYTTIVATGLPTGYQFNATYDNMTHSTAEPQRLSFYTPVGAEPLVLYALSNESSNSTTICKDTYRPIGYQADKATLVDAGSIITINYVAYEQCSPLPQGVSISSLFSNLSGQTIFLISTFILVFGAVLIGLITYNRLLRVMESFAVDIPLRSITSSYGGIMSDLLILYAV